MHIEREVYSAKYDLLLLFYDDEPKETRTIRKETTTAETMVNPLKKLPNNLSLISASLI